LLELSPMSKGNEWAPCKRGSSVLYSPHQFSPVFAVCPFRIEYRKQIREDETASQHRSAVHVELSRCQRCGCSAVGEERGSFPCNLDPRPRGVKEFIALQYPALKLSTARPPFPLYGRVRDRLPPWRKTSPRCAPGGPGKSDTRAWEANDPVGIFRHAAG